MAKYLFDTNILLRLSDRISANYALYCILPTSPPPHLPTSPPPHLPTL
ncbi:DNA recombination and repair protein RecF [Microcystis sp. 0824]|nr:DNA recombination and repair protein RecF [Microcystis sp. 0824]